MIYTFKNNDTGEVFEKHMRMAEQKPYLEENPNMSLVITPSKIVGGHKTMNKTYKAELGQGKSFSL